MKVVAVVRRKGRVGKTTIATHLTVAVEKLRVVAVVLDFDPQASAASWGDIRGGAPCVREVAAWIGWKPRGRGRTDVARYGQTDQRWVVARLLPPESSPVAVVSQAVGVSVATLECWERRCWRTQPRSRSRLAVSAGRRRRGWRR